MEAAGANSDAGSDVPDDANISDVDSEAEFGHDSSGVSDDEEANVGLESDGEGADEAAAGDEDGSEIASEAEDDEGVAQIICFGCQTPMNFSRIKLAPATGYMTECDGGCHRALPPAELRYVCPMSCDFDVCTVCAGIGRASATIAPSLPVAHQASAAGPSVPPPPSAPPPPPPAGLVIDFASLLAKVKARQQQPQRDVARSMALFREWQSERAASAQQLAAARGDGGGGASATVEMAEEATVQAEVEAEADADAAMAEPNPPPSASTATPATNTSYALPSPPDFPPTSNPADLRELVTARLTGGDASRESAIAFAREVFAQLRTADLPNAGDGIFGNTRVGDGEDHVVNESTATPSAVGAPRQFQVVLHQPQPVVAVTYMERCYCCDEEVGGGDGGQCSALQLLASLRDEMERRDEMIEAKVAEGEVDMDFERKGARYFMYRTFVAAKYGYLGPGLRYKLPDCVVAAIRSRYRALACDCDTVRDLAACTEHGYTGYRER